MKLFRDLTASVAALVQQLQVPDAPATTATIGMIAPITSVLHTNPVMTPEQLMFATAKINSELSHVELNMKMWEEPTQQSWLNYKVTWIQYVKAGGQKLYLTCVDVM